MEPLKILLESNAAVLAVLFGMLGLLVAFMTRYLDRGRLNFTQPDLFAIQRKLFEEIQTLKAEMSAATSKAPRFDLSEEERSELLNALGQSLREEAAGEVLSGVRASVERLEEEAANVKLVFDQGHKTLQRLYSEIYSLGSRSNVNLMIGVATALIGLTLFGLFLFLWPVEGNDLASFWIGFIPRASLVLLIEVFAYFFLRLYRDTLAEIKHFHNELTSMESKVLALSIAAKNGSAEQLGELLEYLIRMERNFVLNKNQTTIELERARMDHRERIDVWDKLGAFLNEKKAQ